MARLTITELRLIAGKMVPILIEAYNEKVKSFEQSEEFKKIKQEYNNSEMILKLRELRKVYKDIEERKEKMEEDFKAWKEKYYAEKHIYGRQYTSDFLSEHNDPEKWLKSELSDKILKERNFSIKIDEDAVVTELLVANISAQFNFDQMLEAMKKSFGL